MSSSYNFPVRAEIKGKKYSFIEGPDAPRFLEEYNSVIMDTFEYIPNELGKLSIEDVDRVPTVVGCGLVSSVFANRILKIHGHRTVDISDIHKKLEGENIFDYSLLEALGVKGVYCLDLGVFLRSRDGSNSDLADKLVDQVEERGFNLEVPLYIPSYSLEVIRSDLEVGCLELELGKNPRIVKAPELAHENNLKYFETTDRRGFPRFNNKDESTRRIFTEEGGLTAFSLNENGDLDSSIEYLSESNNNGRLVLVNIK